MKKTGPYVIVDGKETDSVLWAAEMDQEIEDSFDRYMFIQAVGEEAEKELKRLEHEEERNRIIEEGERCFKELMKGF